MPEVPGADGPALDAEALVQRQREVVAALTGTDAVPVGFDASRLEVARRALLHKRARALHHVWPRLVTTLGDRLHPLFDEFAASRPTRGARADGYAFGLWLDGRGELPVAAAVEQAHARLFWRFPEGSTPETNTAAFSVERFPGGGFVRYRHRVWSWGRP